VWQNNIEGVRLLVKAGAQTDIRGKNGETPLDLARKNGLKEIVAILSGGEK
jgi:ankyrin repeat protein